MEGVGRAGATAQGAGAVVAVGGGDPAVYIAIDSLSTVDAYWQQAACSTAAAPAALGRRTGVKPAGLPQPGRHGRRVEADVRPVELEVVVVHARRLNASAASCAQSDVGLDLVLRPVHVGRHPGDLEHRLLVATRRHDVGVGLLLNAFDRRA